MKQRVLFVLRGRPGLGHVVPGVAIAHEARRRGHAVRIVTYENGTAFLRGTDLSCTDVPLPRDYEDWPGLDLYDDGTRRIAPVASEFAPSIVVMGGEYVLAPLPKALGCAGVMIFNPEIMEDTPRNALWARLFADLFSHCSGLIPLRPLGDVQYVSYFHALRSRLLSPGPFVINPEPGDVAGNGEGIDILIANGGGISFPASAASYSSAQVTTAEWIEQTRALTWSSVAAVAAAAGRSDRLHVFSCLGSAWNDQLREAFAGRLRITVREPSFDYYRILRRAAVIVSRAGAGFIADALTTDAEVVLWALDEHVEQQANALDLCRRRKGTRYCVDDEGMMSLVAEAMAGARQVGRRSDLPANGNAAAVVNDLEALVNVREVAVGAAERTHGEP